MRANLYNFIFILRVWRDGDSDPHGWRVTVEDTATGQRWGFGELKQAVHFIESEMAVSGPTGDVSS